MKLLHLKDIPVTKAHDEIFRQKFISPGDLKSKIQTVNFATLDPGKSSTKHAHPDCEECFFIIEGEAEAIIDGQKAIIRKGDFLVAKVNETHVFINNSNKIFKYFAFRILL